MAKIYTVSADSTYVPTHFGGGRAARKIDTVPNPLNQEGLALTLNAEFVKHAVCVPSAGHEAQIAFSALHPAIYTTGLFQCFAVCVAYNKVGQECHNGYLAHISSTLMANTSPHALKKFRTRTTRGQSLASVQGTGER